MKDAAAFLTLTFDRLLHGVTHEGSEVVCRDGRVRLRDETVRSLPRALCERRVMSLVSDMQMCCGTMLSVTGK